MIGDLFSDWRERKLAQWDRTVLRAVCKQLRLPSGSIAQATRELGYPMDGLASLYQAWPNFPLRLAACVLPRPLKPADLADLMKSPVFPAWQEAVLQISGGQAAWTRRGLGVVFSWVKNLPPWNKIVPVVLHNLGLPGTDADARRVVRLVQMSATTTWVLEPLSSFLERAHGFQP